VQNCTGELEIEFALWNGGNAMKILPDYLPKESRLVIIGCNPSLVAARTGFYYSGRGNQFWSLLHDSGLVPEQLKPIDSARVVEFGIGLTDLVKRPTTGSDGVSARDFGEGRNILNRKLKTISCPRVIVFNGKIVYEQFMRKKCSYGLQGHLLFGARVYVTPSTSRRCARIPYREKLQHFRRVFQLVERTKGRNAK
jgi:TDG/mug DNA glycosylase family protein